MAFFRQLPRMSPSPFRPRLSGKCLSGPLTWAESGNDLGNHSYSHPDFNQLTIEQMKREIVSGERSISEILRKVGRRPLYIHTVRMNLAQEGVLVGNGE